MKKTILVVDDFSNSLFVTGFSLQSKGYNILKASSGNEALQHLNGQVIDLVVTDYNMPKMNGIELVEQIKQTPGYDHIPIFILSNEIKPEIKEKAIKAGVTLWIKKPFMIDQLQKLVERAMQ